MQLRVGMTASVAHINLDFDGSAGDSVNPFSGTVFLFAQPFWPVAMSS